MAKKRKILNVPIIPQPGTSLCWAASMKMVMNALENDRVQILDLVKTYLLKLDAILTPEEINDCNFKKNTCSKDHFLDDSRNNPLANRWNSTLPKSTKNVENYFDAIFSDNGYYSIQDYTISLAGVAPILIWKLIVNQIETQRRPLILVLKDDIDTHAVCIRGFWQDTDGTKYIYVNDPLAREPCDGESYSLHFENLVSGSCAVKAIALIHSVRLKDNFDIRNDRIDFDSISYKDLGINLASLDELLIKAVLS